MVRVGTRLQVTSAVVGLLLVGCTSTGRQTAGRGAVSGAAAGAVGAAFSAAIFGDDIGRAASRGAAYGAGAGAVSGAMRGDQAHKAEEKQQRARRQAEVDARIAELRKEIGEDAFSGVTALAEGKHEVALAYARTAQRDANRDWALAGHWLEAVTYADAGEVDEVDRVLPGLVESDPKVSDVEVARATVTELQTELVELRKEFDL